MAREPSVTVTSGPFRRIAGRFYRTVARAHRADALLGSTKAGRYSRPHQRTLYLSASPEGVEAAMIAHPGRERRLLLAFDVQADGIFDLRDATALDEVRAGAGDPFCDWQRDVAEEREPSSWRVRDLIEGRGAMGVIDPSRQAPGLWHLVLFRWNEPGAPVVAPCRFAIGAGE